MSIVETKSGVRVRRCVAGTAAPGKSFKISATASNEQRLAILEQARDYDDYLKKLQENNQIKKVERGDFNILSSKSNTGVRGIRYCFTKRNWGVEEVFRISVSVNKKQRSAYVAINKNRNWVTAWVQICGKLANLKHLSQPELVTIVGMVPKQPTTVQQLDEGKS